MAVLGGTADVAFAAVRPPGHHAESDQLAGMSECAHLPACVLHIC
jgi:acetoin utilization deacetylase AcuC-like enzyme